MVKPRIFIIFHLQDIMEMMAKRSMRNRRVAAQKSPLLLTATGVKLWRTEYRNHGTGRLLIEMTVGEIKKLGLTKSNDVLRTLTDLTVILKMLLPRLLDTAMLPRPLRVTMTLVMRSGLDAAAARMVVRFKVPKVSPT